MKTIAVRFRKQIQVIATLAFCFFLIALYSLYYIPRKEVAAESSRFRILKRIDENIHKKLTDTQKTLKLLNTNLAPKIFIDSVWLKNKGAIDFLDSFKKKIDAENINIKIIEKKEYDEVRSNSDFVQPGILNRIINISYVDSVKSKCNSCYDSIPLNVKKKETRFKNDSSVIEFQTEYSLEKRIGKIISSYYKIELSLSFEKFIKPLLRQDMFDGYIVFNNKSVIYEDNFSSGFTYKSIDSLFNAKNGLLTGTTREIIIAGVKYKIFLLPIGFKQNNELILAGCVRIDKWNHECRSMPDEIVYSFLFILILVILLLPVLKLLLMRKTEKLGFVDVIFSYASLLYIFGLLAFIFCFWISNQYYFNDRVYESLKSIGSDINTKFTKEISSTTELLSVVHFPSDSFLLKNNSLKQNNDFKFKTLYENSKNKNFVFSFLLDAAGNEKDQLLLDSTNPYLKNGNYESRNYFKKLQLNEPNFKGKYYIEPLISWLDGTFKTAISMKDTNVKDVKVLSCRLNCFTNPVLPFGYGFAVIDAEGKVLYCSDSTKNLNENFYEECAFPEEMIAAGKSGNPCSFKATYYGNQYLMQATPIKGLPYFTVTYANRQLSRGVNARVLAFVLSCIGIFSICYLIEILFIVLLKQRRIAKSKIATKTVNTSDYELNFDWLFIAKYNLVSFTIANRPMPKLGVVFIVISLIEIVALIALITFFNSWIMIFFTCFLSAIFTSYIIFKKVKDTETGAEDKQCENLILKKHNWSALLFIKMFITTAIPIFFLYSWCLNNNLKVLENFILDDFYKKTDASFKNKANEPKPSNYYIDHNYITDSISDESNNKVCLTDLNKNILKNLTFNVSSFSKSISDSYESKSGSYNNKTLNTRKEPYINNGVLKYMLYYMIVFVLLLFIMYRLVSLVVDKIFGFNTTCKLLNLKLKPSHNIPPKNKINADFILMTAEVDYAEMSKLIYQDNQQCRVVDFVAIPDGTVNAEDIKEWNKKVITWVNSSLYENILICNFHYNMFDPLANRQKLNFIEQVLKAKNENLIKSITIFSSIEPIEFLNSIKRNLKPNDTNIKLVEEDQFRWAMLLGMFNYYPSLFIYESHKRNGDEVGEIKADISFYHYLKNWNQFTIEEKILLIDLSTSDFFNANNYEAVKSLYFKEIVKIENYQIKFTDMGFRLFVRKVYSDSDFELLKEKLMDANSWQDYKHPIMISLAAVLWFVLYSSPDVGGYVIPTITALVTGLPTLLKAFSIFGSGGSKEKM